MNEITKPTVIDIRIQPRSRQVIGSVATVRSFCSGERPASGAYGAGSGRPSTLLAIRRCALASHRVVGIADREEQRADPDHHQHTADDPEHEHHDERHEGRHLQGGVPGQPEAAEGWIK